MEFECVSGAPCAITPGFCKQRDRVCILILRKIYSLMCPAPYTKPSRFPVNVHAEFCVVDFKVIRERERKKEASIRTMKKLASPTLLGTHLYGRGHKRKRGDKEIDNKMKEVYAHG